jgi:hypothetical protein
VAHFGAGLVGCEHPFDAGGDGVAARRHESSSASPARTDCISSTTASARGDKGRRCSRRPFILPSGTVQVLSRSQRAPITSPVRAAARIANSRVRAATPSCWRRLARKPGRSTSLHGHAPLMGSIGGEDVRQMSLNILFVQNLEAPIRTRLAPEIARPVRAS